MTDTRYEEENMSRRDKNKKKKSSLREMVFFFITSYTTQQILSRSDVQMMVFDENNLTVEQYLHLRQQVRWNVFSWRTPFLQLEILNHTRAQIFSGTGDEAVFLIKTFPTLGAHQIKHHCRIRDPQNNISICANKCAGSLSPCRRHKKPWTTVSMC